MRIAFFDNLPDGGAKRLMYEEIRGLSKKHDLYYFSQIRSHLFDPDCFCQKVFYYNSPKLLGFRPIDDFVKLTWSLIIQKNIAILVNQLKCEKCVVHADINLEAPFLLRFLKTKSIYYSHEPYRLIYDKDNQVTSDWPLINRLYEAIYRNVLKILDRRNILSAGKVLTNSHFTKQQLFSTYGIKAEVVYPGVDRHIFKDLKIKKLSLILYMGSKNMIDGWDRLQKLKPYFRKRGVRVKTLYFQKPLTDQQLVVIYNRATCLLALDRQEPFGLKVIEALACGTDVIALSDGGYPEIAQLYQKYGIEYFSWKKHNENLLNYC